MRKVVLILILTFMLATPVLAAEQSVPDEQAKQWDQLVLQSLEDKYGGAPEYDRNYVEISDWTIVGVDDSNQQQSAQQQIAEIEEEIKSEQNKAAELEDKLTYFQSIASDTQDEAYKEELAAIVDDTQNALDKARDNIESSQQEIEKLSTQQYPDQIAVAFVDIHFGGKVLGTMEMHQKFFIDPATNELLEAGTAQKFTAVSEFINAQPASQTQAFRYETVGLIFLALGLGGWFVAHRKL